MKKIKSRNLRSKNQGLLRLGLVAVLLIIVCCGNYVNAGMNDSVIEKNRMDNVYAVATVEGVTRIFYLNMYEMNDRIAYCIDLGVDITTSIYHSTSDFSVSYLTREQIDYIRAIGYFGYGYEGHNSYLYYMAAQELIWEYLSNTGVEWTNELKVNGERINIDSYKEEILKLKGLYDRKLDLEWESGQAYKVGEEIVLSDNNDVLSEYEVVSSKYSDVSIDGNNLVIKVGNVLGEEQISLRKNGYYDFDSYFYYYDGSQRLISSGNYKEVESVLSFDVEGLTLIGKVVDSSMGINCPRGEATLEGAIYEIYDESDNLIGTYGTNEKGIFKVNNLVMGNYYIKQIKASEGYLVNDKVFEVEINEDNLEVILPQQVVSNNIEIKKIYGSDGNYKPEDKVMFGVYYRNSDSFFSYLFTDSNGVVDFNLPYGSYEVRQITTTYGYSMVDNFFIDVVEQSTDVIYYNLVDETIKVKIKIINFEKISGERLSLEGFSYRIKKKDDEDYLEFENESIFMVDSDGEVFVPISLSYGDYVLEQVSVPEGILLREEGMEFSINDNSILSLVNGDLIMEVDVSNELITGRVEVIATEEVFYKEVNYFKYEFVSRSDSNFRLIAEEDIIVNNNVMYKGGQEIYNEVTDKDGILIIDNLYLGNYCLIDEETEEEKCFRLESVDNKTRVVNRRVEFVKTLDKSNIIIQNITSDGNSIFESVFELVDNEGIVINTGVTNEEGIIKIEDVVNGNYCVRQKSVSANYLKNDEEICFVLEEDKTIDFVNRVVIRESIEVPNTLSEDVGFYEIMVILAMIGTGIFVYKKIFVSKLYC